MSEGTPPITPSPETRRIRGQEVLVIPCSKDERDWVKHAAKLRGLSLVEYLRRAINASLRKEGVDAVLLTESDKP